MGFLNQPSRISLLGAGRWTLGLAAAPVVPALAFTFPSFVGADILVVLGAISVITVFFPLLVVVLPRTCRPLLASIVVGALAAIGPVGIIVAAGEGRAMAALLALIEVGVRTAPLGAVGGAVFWFCALWRNPDFRD